MKRLLLIGTSAKMRVDIKQICGKSFIIDDAEHLNHEEFLDKDYSALILMIDENPDEILMELQSFTLKPVSSMPPIILATRHPQALYVRQGLRRGAVDYIDLNSHYFLISNRISNIMRLAAKESMHTDSINRLLFYRCIGPAIMIEVSDDNVIQVLMVNNQYYELIGLSKNHYDNTTNLLDTVYDFEMDSTLKAIQKAKVNGISETLFTGPDFQKTFRAVYRLMLKEESSAKFLVQLYDYSEIAMRDQIDENIMKLPGMALFDYNPEDDSAFLVLNDTKNSRVVQTYYDITDPVKQKLFAPESFPVFMRAFAVAKKQKVSDSIDVRILFRGELKWYRLYYRSIPNVAGKITKIVGRLDDLSNEDWMSVRGIQSGLCDAETHLPTYRTACQFIEQILSEHKQGTLILLFIKYLEIICADMTTFVRQTFLQEIVRTLNTHFISTDIIGRFDAECFMVFMPETTSHNLAAKKAKTLIQSVEELLPKDQHLPVNAGICIIGPQHGSLETIISESSLALWNAVRRGPGEFEIFDHSEVE